MTQCDPANALAALGSRVSAIACRVRDAFLNALLLLPAGTTRLLVLCRGLRIASYLEPCRRD
jgi:hypothetical protein